MIQDKSQGVQIQGNMPGEAISHGRSDRAVRMTSWTPETLTAWLDRPLPKYPRLPYLDALDQWEARLLEWPLHNPECLAYEICQWINDPTAEVEQLERTFDRYLPAWARRVSARTTPLDTAV